MAYLCLAKFSVFERLIYIMRQHKLERKGKKKIKMYFTVFSLGQPKNIGKKKFHVYVFCLPAQVEELAHQPRERS